MVTKPAGVPMPNPTPLNPDALDKAALAMCHYVVANREMGHGIRPVYHQYQSAKAVVSAYLAVAQPEVSSVEELAKAWYVGFCKGEQTAFRDRPVNPDTINPYKNGETP